MALAGIPCRLPKSFTLRDFEMDWHEHCGWQVDSRSAHPTGQAD